MKNYNSLTFNITGQNTRFEYLFTEWVSTRFFKVPGNICDIGSGSGSNAISFKKLGYSVTALDFDDYYFTRLKTEGISCKKADIDSKKLPFKNNEMDYFFVKSVVEHLENPLGFIKEMNRCLKKGGKIFVLTPDWLRGYKEFYNDPTHKSPFSQYSLRKALTMNGFKVRLVRRFRNIPYLWRHIGMRAFDFKWFFSKEIIAFAEKV